MPFEPPAVRSYAVKVPPSCCPHCGVECVAVAGQAPPSPDEVTICVECAGVCVFNEHLILRKPNPEETAEFAQDEDIRRMVAMVPILQKEKRKRGLK